MREIMNVIMIIVLMMMVTQIIQVSHLLMMVQHDKKTDTGKLNFGQYHCIIANREILGNIGKSRHSCAIQESKAANNNKQGLPITKTLSDI